MNRGREDACYARSGPVEALTWTTVAFFAGFAGVSAFGPIVPKLKQTMDAGPFLMGLLAASPALTGSLLRIPFGAMVDRVGGKAPILILLGLAAAGLAGITLMFAHPNPPALTDYPWFLLFGILCGCGIAVFSVGIPAVSYWYPQARQGTALALYAGLGNLAPGAFALLLPFLVTRMGFTWSYVAWLLLLSALTILVLLRMKDAPYFQYRRMGLPLDAESLAACGEELIPGGNAVESIRKAAGDWRTWILTYFYFVSFGGFIALTVWLPTYWTAFFKVELVAAGLLTAAFSISASFLRVAGGMLSDRVGGERVAVLSLAVLGLGALSLMQVERSLPAALAGTLVVALGMGFANAAVFKLVPKFTPKAVGGAAGIIGGLGAFGGFAIPPLMGLFVARYGDRGYAQGFGVFVGLTVAAVALFAVLKRAAPRAERTPALTRVK